MGFYIVVKVEKLKCSFASLPKAYFMMFKKKKKKKKHFEESQVFKSSEGIICF